MEFPNRHAVCLIPDFAYRGLILFSSRGTAKNNFFFHKPCLEEENRIGIIWYQTYSIPVAKTISGCIC